MKMYGKNQMNIINNITYYKPKICIFFIIIRYIEIFLYIWYFENLLYLYNYNNKNNLY